MVGLLNIHYMNRFKIYYPISQETYEVQQFNLVIGWVSAN